MNSFIYGDQDLLQQLYRIAQQQPGAVNENQLQNAAIQMINRLQAGNNPVQADTNPTVQNLVDVPTFNDWLKNQHVSYDGMPVFLDPNGAAPDDIEALTGVLQDLYTKSKASPAYHTAVGNIVAAYNKKLGLNIKLDDVTDTNGGKTNPDGSKGKPGDDQNAGGSAGQLNVKLDSSVVDEDGQSAAGQAGNAAGAGIASKFTQQEVSGAAINIHFFDGINIDFEDIMSQAGNMVRTLKVKGPPPLYASLYSSLTRMGMIHSQYTTATSKGGAVDKLTLAPNGTPLQFKQVLDSTFETTSNHRYVLTEMATISRCYYDLMLQCDNFLSICAAHRELAGIKDDINSQRNVARQYAENFLKASNLFLDDIRLNPGGPLAR